MVTCRKCGSNKWKILKTTKKSSNAICLECVKCGNKEPAFYKDGRVLVSKKGAIKHYGHSFVPLKCPICGRSEWEILQGEINCRVCKEKFPLDEGIEVSKKTRYSRKEGDYWGKKPK